MNLSDWFKLVTPIIHFKLFKRAIHLRISTSLVRLVTCETELFQSLNPFGLKKYQCSNRIVNLLIQIGALILIQNRTFLCFLKCIYLIQISIRSEVQIWNVGFVNHCSDRDYRARSVDCGSFGVCSQIICFRSGFFCGHTGLLIQIGTSECGSFFQTVLFLFLNRTKHQTIKAVQ